MSYTMGTIMLTGSCGTGIRCVSCNCEAKETKHIGLGFSMRFNVMILWYARANGEVWLRLTKKSILDLSTTAMVPGGAMGGALGGMVRQNWTFHFSCAAWSGNYKERHIFIAKHSSNYNYLYKGKEIDLNDV